jgi:hypothetical protein
MFTLLEVECLVSIIVYLLVCVIVCSSMSLAVCFSVPLGLCVEDKMFRGRMSGQHHSVILCVLCLFHYVFLYVTRSVCYVQTASGRAPDQCLCVFLELCVSPCFSFCSLLYFSFCFSVCFSFSVYVWREQTGWGIVLAQDQAQSA